jgi:hypothetical protein
MASLSLVELKLPSSATDRHHELLAVELVDQSAGLNPVRRRNQADSTAVGELLEVGELPMGG